MRLRRALHFLEIAAYFSVLSRLPAQTTQGVIVGQVFDAETRQPISVAKVTYSRLEHRRVLESGSGQADAEGRFAMPFLSPGTFHLQVCVRCGNGDQETPAPGDYQPQEIYGLELSVAARLEVNFALRKLTSVWGKGIERGLYEDSTTAIVHYYASDVAKLRSAFVQLAPSRIGPLGATVSYVVDPLLVDRLPFTGRDVYAALVLEPGVAADKGTARGQGLSSNGQRPASSNYLLDGIENNNALVTGPLTVLLPEMVQEYRISTSTWSAEYGGTAGFVSNAITRAGGAAWHGSGYFNLKNDALNANTFQNNVQGIARLPLKETQYGFHLGGPVRKRSLAVSGALDIYSSRASLAPKFFAVASPLLVRQLSPGSAGHSLLTAFPTPATDPGDTSVSLIEMRQPVSLERKLGLARADYQRGAGRFMVRVALNRFERPDFIWYPYKEFISGLTQPLNSLAAAYTRSLSPRVTQELRIGLSTYTLTWDRARPEIPTIAVTAPESGEGPAPLLPGSPAFYGLDYRNRTFQVNETLAWARGAHMIRFGGGVLARHMQSRLSMDAGQVTFNTIGFFVTGSPNSYRAAVNRLDPQMPGGPGKHAYRNQQVTFFAEDTWKPNRRFSMNGGVRAEHFGSPVNVGSRKSLTVDLGEGTSFEERLAHASYRLPGSGAQRIYSGELNLAPRVGFAWQPLGEDFVVRGGYGIFFDRPFDNYWDISANNIVLPPAFECVPDRQQPFANLCRAGAANPKGYFAPTQTLLSLFSGVPFAKTFPAVTLVDPSLFSGYTQSFFGAVQTRLTESWALEFTGMGSLGRRLLTTDVVNRADSAPQGRFNNALPDIQWRSNQGASQYHAFTAVARHRSRHGAAQVSYTWSHTIDNQSDPLVGDYFDLTFVNAGPADDSRPTAAFLKQFDSALDRGNSDFDQRHNLVFYSWWNVPAAQGERWWRGLTQNWRVAQMAAFRSGFPYTVRSGATGALRNQRANLVNPSGIKAPERTMAEPGSVALLNPGAFATPAFNTPGNTGRNAFGGPGLWNLDLSVSRSFLLGRLGESRRIEFRADFFNAFNHANLNNPDSRVGSPTFGQASYGRRDYSSGFPALIPFDETPRQVQLLLRLKF